MSDLTCSNTSEGTNLPRFAGTARARACMRLLDGWLD